ncbi:MAG: cytochrome c peroxidase [Gemmatimonadaceae bacterium]|nr:cytochrome c peroxidase [Gemmatimonadaceae bacterium]
MDRRSTRTIAAALVAALAACDAPRPVAPAAPPIAASRDRDGGDADTLARTVRLLAAARGIVPLPQPPRIPPALVRLGRALAFDRILSGNRDIACMTCHAASYATGDGKSLSIGQGGVGLGPTRYHPKGIFIPRNAPPLFNLFGMKHLFWDGRVEVDSQGHLHTPAGAQLTPQMARVLRYGPVSAIGMFPVTVRAEMRGDGGNELAALGDDDYTGIWNGLMKRLGRIPEYRAMFEAAYPGERFDRMNFAYASNAIGAFIVDQLTLEDTPWDGFLAGHDDALSPRQLQGAETFLTLKCSLCHNGATLSDQQFHDVAVAQIGPGEGDGVGGHDDFGRFRVTHNQDDLYRFRTTPLRNVELTGPYGHDGAIVDLRSFIAHYSESDVKLTSYDPSQLEPLLRNTLVQNESQVIAARDTLILGVVLTDDLVSKLVDYMSALTDPRAAHLDRLAPVRVPSGLPVDR